MHMRTSECPPRPERVLCAQAVPQRGGLQRCARLVLGKPLAADRLSKQVPKPSPRSIVSSGAQRAASP
eukprot:7817221-Pyramimonas_sp.AAC.1